jgi:hypothetical protein
MSDIPFGADAVAGARPAASVKAGRSAAPHCGVALTGADRGALRSDAALVASAAWAEGGGLVAWLMLDGHRSGGNESATYGAIEQVNSNWYLCTGNDSAAAT